MLGKHENDFTNICLLILGSSWTPNCFRVKGWQKHLGESLNLKTPKKLPNLHTDDLIHHQHNNFQAHTIVKFLCSSCTLLFPWE